MWSLTHGILVTLALPDGRGRIDTRERRCGHNDMRMSYAFLNSI